MQAWIQLLPAPPGQAKALRYVPTQMSAGLGCLRIRITSTRAARRAGMMLARTATTLNVTVVRTITHRSDGVTP